MKKITFLFVFCILILFSTSSYASDNTYNYLKSTKLILGEKEAEVNYKPATLDQPAYSKNGRTLVPLRFLGESLGAIVTWDNKKNQATLKFSDKAVIITIGSKVAYINNEISTLDVPPETKGGRIFIPLRFVSEALGAKVDFDKNTQSVEILLLDKTNWQEYSAPNSGLKYKYPSDWNVSPEDSNNVVEFTSRKENKLFAYYVIEKPNVAWEQIKELAKENNWNFEGEFPVNPNEKNAGVEIHYSKFDTQTNSKVWYIIFIRPLDSGSLVGEVIVKDADYNVEPLIMFSILTS